MFLSLALIRFCTKKNIIKRNLLWEQMYLLKYDMKLIDYSVRQSIRGIAFVKFIA